MINLLLRESLTDEAEAWDLRIVSVLSYSPPSLL